MFLRPFQEILGHLKSISSDEQHLKITLTHNFEINIPSDAVLSGKLKNLLGKKIGIINIDGNYKIREIKNREINQNEALQNHPEFPHTLQKQTLKRISHPASTTISPKKSKKWI